MKKIAFSSEVYPLKAEDLKTLSTKDIKALPNIPEAVPVVLFLEETKITIIKGADYLKESKDESYIPCLLAYLTPPPLFAFFINLIKPLKRQHYIKDFRGFRISFEELIKKDIERGKRNRENAYQWTNKKWQIPKEEATKRYEELYQSMKTNGYDKTHPMIVMLNRKYGIKDQILQGHHRIGIAKELGLKEVAISFWAAPKSFDFIKKITLRKKS